VKWIFKIKIEQDGTLQFKSRIVLKGYVMIPGVDYTEFSSPVATDTTVRSVVAIAIYRQGEGCTRGHSGIKSVDRFLVMSRIFTPAYSYFNAFCIIRCYINQAEYKKLLKYVDWRNFAL
jgi:hypothetical protein